MSALEEPVARPEPTKRTLETRPDRRALFARAAASSGTAVGGFAPPPAAPPAD